MLRLRRGFCGETRIFLLVRPRTYLLCGNNQVFLPLYPKGGEGKGFIGVGVPR